MCGRFEQSASRQEYVEALGEDTRGVHWIGGNIIPQYNVSPGRGVLVLHTWEGHLRSDYLRWGYRTPQEAAHIARSRSVPSEEFQWWKVSRAVNVPDPNKNNRELLAPIPA